jgi:hypothetical protein
MGKGRNGESYVPEIAQHRALIEITELRKELKI